MRFGFSAFASSPSRRRRRMIGLGLLALCGFMAVISIPAWAADDLQIRKWIDEARTWERKGRNDLAIDIWNKLLLIDPSHGDALVSLGMLEVNAGHEARARELLTRALRAKPVPRGVSRLGEALGTAVAEPRSAAAVAQAPVGDAARTAPSGGQESSTAAARVERSRDKKKRKSAAAGMPTETAASTVAPVPGAVVPSSSTAAPPALAMSAVAVPAVEARPVGSAVTPLPAVAPATLFNAPMRTAPRATAEHAAIPLPADLFGVQGFQPDVIPELGAQGKPRPCTPYPAE